MNKSKRIGVIGAGSFGTTVATLISKNADVLLFAKYERQIEEINKNHRNRGYDLSKNIMATSSLKKLAEECDIIFPVIPSAAFRKLMQTLSPFIRPRHILIHGTKGLDIVLRTDQNKNYISKDNIFSMSDVIKQETTAARIGCLSGPNLSKEIMAGLPTATVLASEFEEVINIGRELLSNNGFFVFGSNELRGAEFAGAYKNIIALGSGILRGSKLGKNIEALLITRGLRELIYLGKAVGIPSKAFLGTAGIGDLIATATSEKSRNFSFGIRIARGETMDDILEEDGEVAEGVRTLFIANSLSNFYRIDAPITRLIYKVIYNGFPIDEAIKYLMSYPFARDVDFFEDI